MKYLPQIVWLIIVAIGWGDEIARHGDLKKGNYNAWKFLLSICISASILYWGGFFDVFFK